MRSHLALLLVGVLGCSKAGTAGEAERPPTTQPTQPAIAPPAPPAPPAPAAAVTVEMTAATLADDCGGAPPYEPPAAPSAKPAKVLKSELKSDQSSGAAARMKAKRRCEQTSMQLAVTAVAGGAPTKLAVKKVELYDETGALVGALTASSPTVWSDAGQYQPWDETIAPAAQLAVSYVLTQPNWAGVANRWNKTYTLKAVISVGGTDQAVQHDVPVEAPTSLPPGVKT